MLYGKGFLLRPNGKVYQRCVQSAVPYGSETWCMNDKEVVVLKRAKKAELRAMCEVKLMDRKSTSELMTMLNSTRWGYTPCY